MTSLTRRRLGLLAGAGLFGASTLPAWANAAQAGEVSPPPFDVAPYLNPEYRSFAGPLMAHSGRPLNAQTLAAERAKMMAGPAPLAQPAWSERTIAGPPSAPPVGLLIINAGERGSARPAILHVHGGGFVLGTARTDLRRLQEIALALDAVIVSVEYRLAPETRFPGPLEDLYTGLKWLHANAASLGADPSRIAVLGDSAGGGLAAMLAIAARDRGEVRLAYQALIYPMLDDRTGTTAQKPPYQGAVIWTPAKNRYGWASLLGAEPGGSRAPYGAVPARVEDLRGLPPTFIGVGSIDLFVDEDIDYARRLVDAGVPVTLDVVPGGFHGFNQVPGSKVAARFNAAVEAALRIGLGVPSPAGAPG